MMVKNISLLGHKDHGKSTLIGSMLMETGSATKVRIREAEEYSKRLGKPFEPAFILDSFAEEREQEMTYDTTRAEVNYKDLAFSFIDVPGHEELIKNMISGASYGDIALLLVSAKKSEGIRDQTKRHLFISRMLGIENLVVAVNKMDLIGYDEKRFNEIKSGLANFIEKIGFKSENIHFVPISAYRGENLVRKSSKMRWYGGRTVLDLLYDFEERGTDSGGPLRILVQGLLVGKENHVVGKLVRGRVAVGEEVCISPTGLAVKVKEITVNGKKAKSAKIGENVALRFDKKISGDLRGSIICSGDYCPVPKDHIKAIIFVVKNFGKSPSIKFNGVDISCNSIKITKYIDTTTGEENTAGKITPLDAVVAEIELAKRIPAEAFDETMELGRFVLYSHGKFAGIGIIAN